VSFLGCARHRKGLMGSGAKGKTTLYTAPKDDNHDPHSEKEHGKGSGGAQNCLHTWIQDEENDPALGVFLVSSQKAGHSGSSGRVPA
jgi:hypothetical protein